MSNTKTKTEEEIEREKLVDDVSELIDEHRDFFYSLVDILLPEYDDPNNERPGDSLDQFESALTDALVDLYSPNN